MSRDRPVAGCHEIAFREPYALSDAAEVSLEDYARVLGRSVQAEAVSAPDGGISGVHLCGLPAPPAPSVIDDVEGFARELVSGAAGGGLGWG